MVTDRAELARLHEAIRARRGELQAEAFALGRTVLAEPQLLVEEVAVAWAQARG